MRPSIDRFTVNHSQGLREFINEKRYLHRLTITDNIIQNLWWGDKSGMRQKGVVTYSGVTRSLIIPCCHIAHPLPTNSSLISIQTKPHQAYFRNYLFNGVRRIGGQVPYWIVPVCYWCVSICLLCLAMNCHNASSR